MLQALVILVLEWGLPPRQPSFSALRRRHKGSLALPQHPHSSPLFLVFVSMLCVHVSVCVHAHVCACGGQRRILWKSPGIVIRSFSETGPLSGLTQLGWLASECQGSCVLWLHMAGIYRCVTSLQDYLTQVLGSELRSLCLEGRDVTDWAISQAPFSVIVLNFRFYNKEKVFCIGCIQGSFLQRVFRCWEAKILCLLFIPLSVGPIIIEKRKKYYIFRFK